MDFFEEAKQQQSKGKKIEIDETTRSLIDIPKFAGYMEAPGAKSLDDDVQKMKVELMKSYEMFQKIGEKLETINFGSLKTRIRDLHLSNANSEAGKMTANELESIFNSSVSEKNLGKLTTDMAQKFRKHPGEFGDIPEVSEFFKACTQLEHGLEQTKRQRIEANDLEKRMMWASENSYKRIDEIRSSLSMDKL